MTKNSPQTKCELCGSTEYSIVYSGKIRDGVYGKLTKHEHAVVKCSSCDLVRLLENPLSMEYYQSDEYRKSYNNTAEASDYIEMHDSEQLPRLQKIGIPSFRDKVVLDYGCGGGAFLDLVKGVACNTIGIEPFQGYHPSLSARGHTVYSDPQSALMYYEGKVDKLVSFFVIEHVEDPVQFLVDAYKLLKKGGSLYVETNNLEEILMQVDSVEYKQFFYRTAHLWYFTADTLKQTAEKAGFTDVDVSFRHNFDLSNAMLWLRDGKPTGEKKLSFLDERINDAWESFLESSGTADTVYIEVVKR